jgi:hypothetical protein
MGALCSSVTHFSDAFVPRPPAPSVVPETAEPTDPTPEPKSPSFDDNAEPSPV